MCAVQLILFSSPSFGFFLCLHVCLCTTIACSLCTPPFSFSLFLRHTAPLSSPSLSLYPHLCSSLWLSIKKEDRVSCTLRLRQATLVVSEGFFLSLLLSVPSIPEEELSRIARSLIELACISPQRRMYGFWSSTLRLRGAFCW